MVGLFINLQVSNDKIKIQINFGNYIIIIKGILIDLVVQNLKRSSI
jgi:hypothetical protein